MELFCRMTLFVFTVFFFKLVSNISTNDIYFEYQQFNYKFD